MSKPGGASFTTSYKTFAYETLMLKSNLYLVGGKIVGCCIAIQNFRKLAWV